MPSESLRSILDTPGRLIRLAGGHNALGATLIETAGFEGVWASSLEISTACGRPDTDAVTMAGVLPAAASMAAAVAIPVVADCGTGRPTCGGVSRMVRAFERAGVAGISMEDAGFPKRNSLLPGEHDLAPVGEFAAKIAAAKQARRRPDFVVIARVEALIAGAGLSEALWRAREYALAGADAILIHSKAKTPDEIVAFIEAWDGDLPLVLVPTTYHTLSVREMLATRKVKMVIYANQAMRAAVCAMKRVLGEILDHGTAHHAERWIAPLDRLFEIQDAFKRNPAPSEPAGAGARLAEKA